MHHQHVPDIDETQALLNLIRHVLELKANTDITYVHAARLAQNATLPSGEALPAKELFTQLRANQLTMPFAKALDSAYQNRMGKMQPFTAYAITDPTKRESRGRRQPLPDDGIRVTSRREALERAFCHEMGSGYILTRGAVRALAESVQLDSEVLIREIQEGVLTDATAEALSKFAPFVQGSGDFYQFTKPSKQAIAPLDDGVVITSWVFPGERPYQGKLCYPSHIPDEVAQPPTVTMPLPEGEISASKPRRKGHAENEGIRRGADHAQPKGKSDGRT